jgi:hypothetical protein
MTTKAEEYLAKARECDELAEQARDPFIKQQFIDIAKTWRAMACAYRKPDSYPS